VILDGTSQILDQPWYPELAGDMRSVVGANELHLKAIELGRAGDWFDLGDLFLQLCVVVGAICLVVKRPAFKNQFFVAMVVLGLIGTIFTVLAFRAALPHV
jgi:hypothetical protein